MIFGTSKSLSTLVVEEIIKDVFNGKISPGEKIISVRERAKQAKINPQTVQKAYNLLTEEQILIPKVGSGNYLTQNEQKLAQLKLEFTELETQKFKELIKTYNLDKALIIKQLTEGKHV